jgi:hypothetical protein
MPLFSKVLRASCGLATMGSPRTLKLVFKRVGIPVALPKFSKRE